jgi:hypothetical protein
MKRPSRTYLYDTALINMLKSPLYVGFNEALVQRPEPSGNFVQNLPMIKLYFSFFLLLTGASLLAQDTTTTPVLNKSTRLILHFTDTVGKFSQLARILVDRGHDIDMKDRELGILRTKPSPLRGSSSYANQVEIKTIFRDSTITFAGVTYEQGFGHDSWYEIKSEAVYSKKRIHHNNMLSWEEMGRIAELLKPAFITYSEANIIVKPYQSEGWQYKRSN